MLNELAECDVCGKMKRGLRSVFVYGTETIACDDCIGSDSQNPEYEHDDKIYPRSRYSDNYPND
jgi:hypothetical protein